ncbi:iron complex outermembrane receptor protein [Neolewinella xylanilytica]|uniref:Iron complex outermembrane receptor protein n=1 Tax=Neolewinella xylanilytica TaxID=1514080 RepID=A0A2S6I460_9BACT|nr:TonB-dependent receptor [Neolewinella xylanilytica]PPK85967.1 iron complex outermembrane receptor protein [Neolewinella xylanilytica]
MRFITLLSCLLLLPGIVRSQACSGTVTGVITDEHETERLAFASIYLVEAERGVQADENGRFSISDVCPGPLTLRFSHIGCDPRQIAFTFTGDTSLQVYLHHHDNYTETVTVNSSTARLPYEERLDRQADRQLSTVLEGIAGVSSLRTGATASKPVFDGLYGNRLSIQNNGIAQSGQQWGNDHAPEIDPWVAAYVRVVEGVDALRYGGSTLGPTVLIEPSPLTSRTEGGGKVAYGLRSNGWGHTLNARITDSAAVAYRVSGTVKFAGDLRAPDYYLTNTGRREGNLAVQVAKFLSPAWTIRGYYSLFNAEIGVLRGSHVGNLSDLTEAIGRDVPFFTEPDFDYVIAAPRQRVSHHLLKAEANYAPSDRESFTLRYGGQLDNRQEFDVRRGSDDQAALELLQFNHLVEGIYSRELGAVSHLEAGVQFERTDNANQPGTGILPLIPDYNATRGGAFLTYHHKPERFRYHAGLRFDHQFYEAITITRERPLRIARFEHRYNSIGASGGASWRISRVLSIDSELTYRQRPPQINELYSQGLHQGVSGIEEGDPALGPERSVKSSLGVRYGSRNGQLTLNGSAFYQPVDNFINLVPQEEFRLTIRGAFPVFRYSSVDALLWGGKFSLLAEIGKLVVDSRIAYVRGTDRDDELPLVYIPPLNWRTTLGYPVGERFDLSGTVQWVARQDHLLPSQDFLPPPPAYTLFSLRLSKRWEWKGKNLTTEIEAENLLNEAYRDYLDRQRYYADSPGRSLNIRLTYSW